MVRLSGVLILALAGFAAGCSPSQYFAQPASVEETRDTVRSLKAQQDDMAKKIEAIQKELESSTGRLAESNANLNAELGSLNDALESLSDRLDDLSRQMQRRSPRSTLPALDEESWRPPPDTTAGSSEDGGPPGGMTEAGGMTPPTPPIPAETEDAPAAPPSVTPAIDPEEVYDAAYRDVSRGSYPLAISGFEEFLRLFPDHSLADNAQYWIGECYYVQNDPNRARSEFRKVLDRYPDGDKVPAAYLKLGYSALKLSNANEARRYFDELIQKYPRSEEARSARQKLQSLQ